MKKSGLIVGLLAVALLVGATGCGNVALGIFSLLSGGSAASSAAAEAASRIAAEESEAASRVAAESEAAASRIAAAESEAASRKAAEESRAAENKERNQESYRQLKEQWDEASRKQQSRVDEIMGRNRGSSAASEGNSGGNTGNTTSKPAVPVSGTWYGPKNEHSGDRTIVALNSDGTAKVTIDMGASEWRVFNATYTSKKDGPYEYDDIVCRVTLNGNTSGLGFPSDTFTFRIDPEVENGLYAVFVESGFGMTPGGATFTKG